ncbi:PREDICTED: death domain-containing protein CRADD-like [Branchiostoma belcheri]|uniref:Death domain-containing protein CRADD-like n=1 Tax=Branchiostoma belcheri TaxID=7741 RepID=A0A6P4ZC56_BRABE|nr:PREDICTED: death domain-containing protein CRADD-like [Branchiostoma belcheri]
MEARHRDILRRNRVKLVKTIKVQHITNFLIQEDVLTETMVEEIMAEKTSHAKAEQLLDTLVTRGPNAFMMFCKSLKESYEWLSKDLLEQDQKRVGTTGTRAVQCEEDVLEDKMARMNLQDSARGTEILREKELNKLASNLGAEWEKLAIELDFKKSELYKFKEDNKNSVHGQIFDMLCTWKGKQGSKATVGNLVHSMIEVSIGEDVYKFLLDEPRG